MAGGDGDHFEREAVARHDALTRTLQAVYVARNPEPLGSKHLLDSDGSDARYSRLHASFHPAARALVTQFGLYDVLLVDGAGRVVYTCSKELDFATELAVDREQVVVVDTMAKKMERVQIAIGGAMWTALPKPAEDPAMTLT